MHLHLHMHMHMHMHMLHMHMHMHMHMHAHMHMHESNQARELLRRSVSRPAEERKKILRDLQAPPSPRHLPAISPPSPRHLPCGGWLSMCTVPHVRTNPPPPLHRAGQVAP